MSQFEYGNTPPATRVIAAGPSWFSMFSAMLSAVVIGGIILGIGLRIYIIWSVEGAADRIKQENLLMKAR